MEDSVGCGGCASVRECAKGREVLGWSRPVGTAENEDERPTWQQSQREQNIQAGCIRLERRHRSQKARLQTWAAFAPPRGSDAGWPEPPPRSLASAASPAS